VGCHLRRKVVEFAASHEAVDRSVVGLARQRYLESCLAILHLPQLTKELTKLKFWSAVGNPNAERTSLSWTTKAAVNIDQLSSGGYWRVKHYGFDGQRWTGDSTRHFVRMLPRLGSGQNLGPIRVQQDFPKSALTGDKLAVSAVKD